MYNCCDTHNSLILLISIRRQQRVKQRDAESRLMMAFRNYHGYDSQGGPREGCWAQCDGDGWITGH